MACQEISNGGRTCAGAVLNRSYSPLVKVRLL